MIGSHKGALGGKVARTLSVASLVVATVGWTTPEAAGPQAAPGRPSAAAPLAAIDQYCVNCHNKRAQTGGLSLEGLDAATISEHADVWEKVVRKLRTGAMPPQGVRRPDRATYDQLIASLETALDKDAPMPGRPPIFHRLNRAEYGNAVRDLLALDVDVTTLLPPDDSAYGFDNIADALGVSPVLMERYLVAADAISTLAIGDREALPGSATYRVRQDLSQDQHIEGLPFGTVGGTSIRHTFPADGEYDFQVKLFRTNSDVMRGLEHPQQLEITVDGQRVFLVTVGGGDDFKLLFKDTTAAAAGVEKRMKVRAKVTAGPHEIAATFLHRSAVSDTRTLQPYLRSSVDTYDFTGRPHIDTVTITGPFNVTGVSETPSRRRVFTCRPSNAADEARCARQILSGLARRAFRRPLTDEDMRPLMAFYEDGRREGTFEKGIQAGVQRILASPMFVFRFEREPARVAPGTVYPIDDVELASSLSFFLWSSIPDDPLVDLAARGTLRKPAILEQQVRRLLADPRSHSFISNFAGQWLQLRNLNSLIPNSEEFPDFDDNLRRAFQKETELFFDSIVREDRSVLDLLTADYTFVNERLARHYGIPNVYGSHFRRVTQTDDARKGLLGKGSILMVTSHADRTSPVTRGKWVLENLLGTPPPAPPPNVPPFPADAAAQTPRSVRERMEQHRANPACASCHKLMDPLGFALENFDAVGKWRTKEAGVPINASGELSDGTKLDGVVSLRAALVNRPEVFVTTLTEKLMTYALGRGLDHADMPAVRRIVRDAGRDSYRFSALVRGIVTSTPFQMRLKPRSGEGDAVARTASR
jgi:hypothetical protein